MQSNLIDFSFRLLRKSLCFWGNIYDRRETLYACRLDCVTPNAQEEGKEEGGGEENASLLPRKKNNDI